MILADSNIFIDLWKHKNKDYQKIFFENRIVISGIIKVELLQGAKDLNSYHKINKILNEFHCIDINPNFWDNLASNVYKLKSKGLTVPIQDVMISTISLNNNIPIWTNDKHFILIRNVIPDLKLF